MKKRIFSALLIMSLVMSTAILGGCNDNSDKDSDSTQTAASAADTTDSSEASEEPSDDTQQSSAEEVSEQTAPEISEQQSSEESSEQESSEQESSEMSFESMTESEALEASTEGYQFDDEQVVTDYHTAETFTDNEFFNDMFKENALDKAFIEQSKLASSTSDMLNLTTEFTAKWRDMADTACEALGQDLDEENNKKLLESQERWTKGLTAQEEAFMSEAESGGTEAVLAANTAIMNYYKGRAAKLFEQLYTINGEIQLSDYGL